jgi:hypothetical protein
MRKAAVLSIAGSLALACAFTPKATVGFELPKIPKFFGVGEDSGGQSPGSSSSTLSCPEIHIVGGSPELRSPPGATPGSVRYQIRLGDMARECALEGDRLSIKVGVEGAAVLGPAGQPGSYYGNLRVAVQRQKDDAVVDSKVYRVGATIPAGEVRAPFRLVADPILVPNGAHAADDYVVIVGMQGGPDAEAVAAKPRGKHRR